MHEELFLARLKRWLKKHPLLGPSQEQGAAFTEDVMRRIRAEQAPSPQTVPIFAPRLAWGMGLAAACLLAVIILKPGPTDPLKLTQAIEEEWNILEAVEQEVDLDGGFLEDELEQWDSLVLAEAVEDVSDEEEVERLLDLLSEMGEEPALEEGGSELEDLLEEFRLLDEAEFTG
ncbi:MAG: hypothetical protein HYY14_00925 [Candidatus Omnitrophica bacterium]|nr:hypothetical protein [Candidatus Omnitrophota bacterium]